MNLNVNVPEEAVLSTGPARMLKMAESFVVQSQDDYELAAGELQAVKAKAKSLEAERVDLVNPINLTVKKINDRFRAPLTYLENAEKALKGSMVSYVNEQNRIAAEARRIAEAEAAAERKRLEDEARAIAAAERERQRIADEAARKEQARIAEESAAAARAGNAAAFAQAQADEARAAQAKREQDEIAAQVAAQAEATLRATAQVITAAAVAPAVVKVSGVSTARSVDFEVTSILELCKHIANGHPEMAAFLKSDDVKIRGYVKGIGMATNVPGIRVYEKTTLRSA